MASWVLTDDYASSIYLRLQGPAVGLLSSRPRDSAIANDIGRYLRKITYNEHYQAAWGPPDAMLGASHLLMTAEGKLSVNLDTIIVVFLCQYTRAIFRRLIQELEGNPEIPGQRQYLNYFHALGFQILGLYTWQLDHLWERSATTDAS